MFSMQVHETWNVLTKWSSCLEDEQPRCHPRASVNSCSNITQVYGEKETCMCFMYLPAWECVCVCSHLADPFGYLVDCLFSSQVLFFVILGQILGSLDCLDTEDSCLFGLFWIPAIIFLLSIPPAVPQWLLPSGGYGFLWSGCVFPLFFIHLCMASSMGSASLYIQH